MLEGILMCLLMWCSTPLCDGRLLPPPEKEHLKRATRFFFGGSSDGCPSIGTPLAYMLDSQAVLFLFHFFCLRSMQSTNNLKKRVNTGTELTKAYLQKITDTKRNI